MCGIVGFSGPLDPRQLTAACDAIAHRGPDDAGIFQDADSRIGLGHRRLSILDPSSRGHQPMESADGSVVLVLNGEIYNFRELRAELEAAGHTFEGHSDTEVLLRLYLENRKIEDLGKLLRRLNGIFAFALWDSVSAELWLARDALGVKPLYYSSTGSAVAFASEIKALLHLTPAWSAPSPDALDRYLSFLMVAGRTDARCRSTQARAGRSPANLRWAHQGSDYLVSAPGFPPTQSCIPRCGDCRDRAAPSKGGASADDCRCPGWRISFRWT